MSSAQLDTQPLDEAAAESEAALPPFALKQQVAERLAAHRARHSQPATETSAPIARTASTKPRAARIAAAVAERYAQTQSYHAFLAAEAERAIRQAEAVAEVAARSAQAIAAAQNELLAELDQWTLTPSAPVVASTAKHVPALDSNTTPESLSTSSTQVSSTGLTVRLYDDLSRPVPEPFSGPFRPQYQQDQDNPFDEEERLALDDEITFRQSPTFDEPSVAIPANLIEFPRQLVASRRARPRIAEGPLREEADHTPDATQLRIFEVEATQISTEPVAESGVPEWSSILLGARPAYDSADFNAASCESPQVPFSPVLPPQTATLDLRLMAGIVDGCIILTAFLAFAAVFALTLAQLPGTPAIGTLTLQTAAIGTGGILAILALVYQALFFTFADATPGMRYARIGLCTFSDENPTRAAMRFRIVAAILSACPLGIGFLWACLDDDRLSWHDRISRMYQRSY
ncbi:MAG: RDD family protein [Edaphobacter sp.]